MIYLNPTAPGLEQGDILDDCPIPTLADGTTLATAVGGIMPVHQVVVLTQTCDLAQGKSKRTVVATVHPADWIVAQGLFKPADVKAFVRTARTFGWYFLPADATIGLPESLVDLRELHTLPLSLLEDLASAGKRVARLAVPYREHLAQHFAVSYMRIALPTQYPTAP